MKQYDKVYVPAEGGQSVVRYTIHNGYNATPIGHVDKEENKIVCSIEDLRELFKAGRSYGREDGNANPLSDHNHPSFEEYMEEKGIKL